LKSDDAVRRDTALMKASGIACEIGGHSPKVLESDFIAISPGIPMDIEILQKAHSRGIPIFSELEASSWFCRVPIIAITGSNGKTTTTTLLGKIISGAGRQCHVGGNIGVPFSSFADEIAPGGYAILEVSSFQLEGIESFQPRIAAVLNFTPDHLDRYRSMNEYRSAKARIYENMGEGDYLILNADDPESSQFVPGVGVKVLQFSVGPNPNADVYVDEGTLMLRKEIGSQRVILSREIGIPGPHNLANSAAAVLSASVIGIGKDDMARALREFKGVEHRLEIVAVVNGIKFVNDSKGTNVDAVSMALKSIQGKIVLIAGGKDKGGDFSRLVPEVREKVCALVLIGEAAEKIALQLANVVPVYRANDMAKAVAMSASLARKGETVLLSPGCASFDMFRDYEHRGQVFKEEIHRLSKHEAHV